MTIARILVQRWTIRSPLLVLVTAVVGLMFPARAVAGGNGITTAGVAKKDRFRLSLNIVQGYS